jgi:AraC family transcriptional regulator, exoenzyme S synthesis regulatory protein ExsA
MVQKKKLGTMTINYSDVFFGFEFAEREVCAHFVKDHMLVYVYNGELTLMDGKETETLEKGQCVFLRRNHNVSMMDTAVNGKVDALFMVFSRKYLKNYYRNMDCST